MNKRRVNKEEMTIVEQLASIKERMCDEYCRHLHDCNTHLIPAKTLDKHCNECPMNELGVGE